MNLHPSIAADVIIDAVSRDDGAGFCTECGIETDGCEPDMRECKCDSCGEYKVYGAEELLFELEC